MLSGNGISVIKFCYLSTLVFPIIVEPAGVCGSLLSHAIAPQWIVLAFGMRRTLYFLDMASLEKFGHQIDSLRVLLSTSLWINQLTNVQQLSLWSITCSAHITFDILTYATISSILGPVWYSIIQYGYGKITIELVHDLSHSLSHLQDMGRVLLTKVYSRNSGSEDSFSSFYPSMGN